MDVLDAFSFLGKWWIWLIPVAYFLATPLLIWLTFRLEAHPNIEKADEAVPLPTDVQSYFYDSHESMHAIGYMNQSTYLLPSPTPNVTAMLALFVNHQKLCAAVACVFYANVNGKWSLQAKHIEFATYFQDESSISTGNQNRNGSFPVRQENLQTIFPDLDDVATLERAHLLMVSQHGRGRRPVMSIAEGADVDASDALREDIEREYENARQMGYLSYHGAKPGLTPEINPYQPLAHQGGEYYSATLKGAYLMTWRELWPIKPVLYRMRVSSDRRMLQEAGWRG